MREADKIVCLGDVAATGPQPKETIDFLRRAKWPCVLGNTDEALAKSSPEDHKRPDVPEQEGERMVALDKWTASKLSESDKRFLSRFQATIDVKVGGRTLMCYHGSPRSNTEQIPPDIPDADLAKIFEGKRALLFAGGHTHSQMVRKFGPSLVINPGSVGLPYLLGLTGKLRNPAWAEYAIVSLVSGDLRVELCRTPYDIGDLKRAVLDSGLPDPAWWMGDWTNG